MLKEGLPPGAGKSTLLCLSIKNFGNFSRNRAVPMKLKSVLGVTSFYPTYWRGTAKNVE